MNTRCVSVDIQPDFPFENRLTGHLYFSDVGYIGKRAEQLPGGRIAVCLAGFNRVCTEENFFQVIARNLNMPCLLFNYAGFGGSEGKKFNFTIDKAERDFFLVLKNLKNFGFDQRQIFPIVHSLGAAVLGKFIFKNKDFNFPKIILLAPALNQAILMRYWFTKEKYPEVDSESFEVCFEQAGGEKCFNFWNSGEIVEIGSDDNRQCFSADYWKKERSQDYSSHFNGKKFLWIHGGSDKTVPIDLARSEGCGQVEFFAEANHSFEGFKEKISKKVNDFFAKE